MRGPETKSGDIDVLQMKLEPHVNAAFRLAIAQAGNRPVEAADLLRAVVQIGPKSTAFRQLSSILPLTSQSPGSGEAELADFQPSKGLLRSYQVAGNILRQSSSDTVWGRDLITLALLADYDPSLNEIASEAGTQVDWLQDQWYNFLNSSEQRQDRVDLIEWWNDAGVPNPDARPSIGGPAYVFTWDSARYESSRLEEVEQQISTSGSAILNWSMGTRRHMRNGDRVFLLRTGDTPGLVGTGTVEGSVAEVPHWDPEQRKQDRTSWIVPVRWTMMSPTPIVPRQKLIAESGEDRVWNTRAGGVRISAELAAIVQSMTLTDTLRFAKTLSDLDHRNDWIGIRSDIEALSTLCAINNMEPPLSIAILGDWGSGKTFLMRRIQRHVEFLEQTGREQTKSLNAKARDAEMPQPLRYCNSILQIEFNAWHYTESNLWASLVNEVFKKLHAKLYPEEKLEGATDTLFQVFETARAAREAAEQQVQTISAEVELAEKKAQKAEEDIRSAQKELSESLGLSVWTYLSEDLKQDGQAKAALNQALQHFGFTDVSESAQTIQATLDRFQSVSGRAKEVFGSLFATPRGVWTALFVAFLIALATAAAVIWKVPILSVGAACATVLAWLTERAASARKWLDGIQSFSDWFANRRQVHESCIAKRVGNARAEFERQKEAVSVATRQLAEAQMKEARAKEDLINLTARDQMRRFVNERVTAQTYAKHLGLISLIRQDFEDLSDFMSLDREDEGESYLLDKISEVTDDPIRESIPIVERIILYIDDLDRCNPERVVEVLEAVHLLLAFRLFVVVVAVDPRWVVESLRRRYPHLAAETVTPTKAGAEASRPIGATAHDYLEKIFNIPFWVKPMNVAACRSLIAGYLGYPDTSETDDPKGKTGGAELYNEISGGRSAQASPVSGPPEVGMKSQTTPGVPGSHKKKSPAQRPTVTSPETAARIEEELASAKRKITTVDISISERNFIERLAPHLGHSPRRIKRYANTYRLMKAGLTLAEAQRFGADGASDAESKVVLVFLAVVTGAPSLAPDVFSRALDMRQNFDVNALIQGITDNGSQSCHREAEYARGALGLLRGISISGEMIETWIPRVMRYAFRLTPVDVSSIGAPGLP